MAFLPKTNNYEKSLTMRKKNEQILSEATFYKLHILYYSKQGKLEKFSFPEGECGDIMIKCQAICGVKGLRGRSWKRNGKLGKNMEIYIKY